MTRIGLIGAGGMGQNHIKNWLAMPDVQLVALADIDPKRAAGDLSASWNNLGITGPAKIEKIKGFTDYRQLLALPEVDIVDVTTPTPLHAQTVIDALKAGKHVTCEKPLARTIPEAQRIVDAAASAKGFFMPAMCMRFWPGWMWLKEAVDDRRYGKVNSATFRRLGAMPGGWFRDGKQSGGALLDLHIHDVDFINYVFGRPKAVASRGYRLGTGEIDHVVTQYHYDHIPIVAAEGGWPFGDGGGFYMQYQVHFEHASADFDLARKDNLMLLHQGKFQPVEVPPGDAYFNELAYFLDCVRKGQRPTQASASDALIGLEIVEAEGRSILNGGKVEPV